MTLDQLRILVKIADSGSILAAARALHRTQPTVSVALRKLEEELNLQLLDRSSYRVSLTDAGRQLYRRAAAILKQADDFSTYAHYLSCGHESTLYLAIEASSPMSLVLDILQNNEKKYPQTEFNLEVGNVWGALEKLLHGDVDLAVSPWFEDIRNLESIALTKTRLLTVAAPGFLPDMTQFEIETMKQYVQVVVRDGSNLGHKLSYGVLDNGRHWVVSDHLTKKALIKAGLGWGKLQEHLIAEELAAGMLLPLTIGHYPCQVEMEIRAVRRLGEPVGPVAHSLWRDFIALSEERETRGESAGPAPAEKE